MEMGGEILEIWKRTPPPSPPPTIRFPTVSPKSKW